MSNYFVLQNVSFSFDQQSQFFQHVSLRIDKPGLIFLVGKNGVGKSTFLRIIQGIIHEGEVCSGVLSVQNKQYDLSSAKQRLELYSASRILHQNIDSMLALQFTGYENLAFANFEQDPNISMVHISKQADPGNNLFDIPLDRKVSLMSGGQRQILALRMVLQKHPDLLLLDEPTAALDAKNSDYVMQEVRQLMYQKNMVIFCISHDARLIEKHADYIMSITENDAGEKIFALQSCA